MVSGEYWTMESCTLIDSCSGVAGEVIFSDDSMISSECTEFVLLMCVLTFLYFIFNFSGSWTIVLSKLLYIINRFRFDIISGDLEQLKTLVCTFCRSILHDDLMIDVSLTIFFDENSLFSKVLLSFLFNSSGFERLYTFSFLFSWNKLLFTRLGLTDFLTFSTLSSILIPFNSDIKAKI
ncbi:hypothetical protein AGLY_000126 [Aphis glycines]|uniref:Uncharacterized protein n=1 Tax=Aphis glycines TaxID=307491 RepID=A0A6G0U684_APHGL|nr:hypothetical protein AGLY_000126 [Aphis glycines]